MAARRSCAATRTADRDQLVAAALAKPRRGATGSAGASFFFKAFVTLFVIIDPMGNVPLFRSLTRVAGNRVGALTLVMASTWLALLGSEPIRRRLRDSGIERPTRVRGCCSRCSSSRPGSAG